MAAEELLVVDILGDSFSFKYLEERWLAPFLEMVHEVVLEILARVAPFFYFLTPAFSLRTIFFCLFKGPAISFFT